MIGPGLAGGIVTAGGIELIYAARARRQGQTPGEAADSLWRALEVLRRHDAGTPAERGVNCMDVDANTEAAVLDVFTSVQQGPYAWHYTYDKLGANYAFFIKVVEGRRLYDLMHAFVHSERHTPMRWACLAVLGSSSWIKRVRVQLLRRAAVLREVLASLGLYADVGHGADATNVFIYLASRWAANTLHRLFESGGGLTGEQRSQLLDLGVLPAMASWFTECVPARDAVARQLPGSETDHEGRLFEFFGTSAWPLILGGASLRHAMDAPATVTAFFPFTDAPPDQALAVLVAGLKPLQGVLTDAVTARVPAEKQADRALWYLALSDDDLFKFSSTFSVVVARFLDAESLRRLPRQLKTDAIQAAEMLVGLGTCPEPARMRFRGWGGAGGTEARSRLCVSCPNRCGDSRLSPDAQDGGDCRAILLAAGVRPASHGRPGGAGEGRRLPAVYAVPSGPSTAPGPARWSTGATATRRSAPKAWTPQRALSLTVSRTCK